MTRARALAAAVLLAACAWALRREPERALLVAVDAEPFARLAGRAPAGSGDLWERLKAMGVGAAVLREESVADLIERGEVLRFSRGEVEKWRALAVVAPEAGPAPGTLWGRDAQAFARLSVALAARGIEASSSTLAVGRALTVDEETDLARVPAGFDPAALAAVSSSGLVPVAASTSPVSVVAGRRLYARGLRVGADLPRLLRAAHGRPARLLVFRPDPALGLEENLALLRESLRALRERGLSGGSPPDPAPEPEAPRVPPLAAALFFAAGLACPLWAARVALAVERVVRARVEAHLPQASPVPQALAGLAAGWACATLGGIAASGLLPSAARQELARAWTVWTMCAPLAVGAASLYASGGPRARPGWARPLRAADLLAAGLAVGAAALLVAPRAALSAAGLWDALGGLGASVDALWWWPWRWREIVIGAPSLTVAMILAARPPAGPRAGVLSDPRGWLALSLLAPSGAMAAAALGAVPPATAALHGAAAFALGGALGLLLEFLRARLEAWALGPINIGPLT